MTWEQMQSMPANETARKIMVENGIEPTGGYPFLLELAMEALDRGRGDPEVENDLLRLCALEPEDYLSMFEKMTDTGEETADMLWDNGPSDSDDATVDMVRYSGIPRELFHV